MKAYSNFFTVILVFILVITSSITVFGTVTDTDTGDTLTLKWATKIGEGWQKPAGVPVIVEDKIVIMSGDELFAVNVEDGSIITKISMAEQQSYGYVAPTFANGKIFMNLSNGTVQAFNAETFESEWVFEDISGGKGMSPVTYSENLVFTGFWNGEKKEAAFVALDSETGEVKWRKNIDGGLYWVGAYTTDDSVIFATDDGTDKIAHIYSCDKTSGEIISSIDVENKGDIRSTVTYYEGRIYATTKGGYLVSAKLDKNILSDVKYGEIGAASTSTPVIYNGRIYIGTANKTISVFDANSLTKLFSVPVKAYPQCTVLLSTTHIADEGYIYLYTTYNSTPGGIILIKIKPDADSVDDCIVDEIYNADGYSQYCISDIIADENGTLYYKNDSGYLFALKDSRTKVRTALIEDGFIVPLTDVKVFADKAESYGYTDTVTDSASALDVLVKIHEDTFGEDFTQETCNDYLSVSQEGYLSRVLCIDTYNFGFAVNGKAPHDDVLTDYGYTGYSLNQSPVKEGDKVEFFFYRDDWALDNYVHFENQGKACENIDVNKSEEFTLTLKGYPFGWYSCYEDSKLENMMMNISNADITVVDPKTGEMETIETTDDQGVVTLSFDMPGKYVISASEREGGSPLIAPWLEINVAGISVEQSEVFVKINANLKCDAYVIIANYNDSMVTDTIVRKIEKDNGCYVENVDISGMDGNIKVFVWNEGLVPITEVK